MEGANNPQPAARTADRNQPNAPPLRNLLEIIGVWGVPPKPALEYLAPVERVVHELRELLEQVWWSNAYARLHSAISDWIEKAEKRPFPVRSGIACVRGWRACTDLNSVCYNSAQSMDRCSASR